MRVWYCICGVSIHTVCLYVCIHVLVCVCSLSSIECWDSFVDMALEFLTEDTWPGITISSLCSFCLNGVCVKGGRLASWGLGHGSRVKVDAGSGKRAGIAY